jgi:inosine-uridine nucleoside N-ribohydrolase
MSLSPCLFFLLPTSRLWFRNGKEKLRYQHGPDGLSNISVTHPHFTPPENGAEDPHDHLEISDKPAYENILDILRKEEAGTVSIVALGPCECLSVYSPYLVLDYRSS